MDRPTPGRSRIDRQGEDLVVPGLARSILHPHTAAVRLDQPQARALSVLDAMRVGLIYYNALSSG